jgi:pyruvate, orthophosphate dikinase
MARRKTSGPKRKASPRRASTRRAPAKRPPKTAKRAAPKSSSRSATKLVYDFNGGRMDMKYLLGGKGANLAEMTNLGLPVPPGFTITTDACRSYMATGKIPSGLMGEVDRHLAALEKAMGRRLGDPADPLLVSVRSGSMFSMPGMMDTVLNLGMNDESVEGLAKQTDDDRFAWDSYRRFIQMFGKTVMGLSGELFEEALDTAKAKRGKKMKVKAADVKDTDLTADDLRALVDAFKRIVKDETKTNFPQNTTQQLRMAIEAVFNSWNNRRAQEYRKREGIDDALGTAVNVQTMVFGNKGFDSGTGVAFTRDPATGASGVYGDFLMNAQGEDVVAGIRTPEPLSALKKKNKKVYAELEGIMMRLEKHYRDMCDIEFTIEQGKLWMLQTRVGKRTPPAAVRLAVEMANEKLINRKEAIQRVTPDQLDQLLHPQFDKTASARRA